MILAARCFLRCVRLRLLLLAIIVALVPANAGANDFVVTETGDAVDVSPGDGHCDCNGMVQGDQCTIRAAIDEANALPGFHKIQLTNSVYVLSIPGIGENSNAAGDLDVRRPDLLIEGNGATIQAATGLGERVLDIYTNVTIRNLTVTGGSAYSTGGGGICLRGNATAWLEKVSIINNDAPYGYGGGIRVETTKGKLVGIDVLIEGNTTNGALTRDVYRGGGLYSLGTVTLENSHVIGNESFGNGGGIYSGDGSTLTLRNVTVSENVSQSDGGGIMIEEVDQDVEAALLGCVIEGDSATALGGGICVFNGEMTCVATQVSENKAEFGGGIYNSGGTCSIRSSTINGNMTSGGSADGGGVLNMLGGLDLLNTTVSGNTSEHTGGGITNELGGTLSCSHSTIVRNSAATGAGVKNGQSFPSTPTSTKVRNTIIAMNTGGDCSGLLTSEGFNIDGDGTCGFTALGDQSNIDPLMGPLQDNGGPTWTHALSLLSPAIDAGTSTDLLGHQVTVDQRGEPRPEDGDGNPSTDECDIGAFEARACLAYGDCNADNISPTVADLTYLVRVLFGGVTPFEPYYECDMNGDCWLDVLDAVVYARYFTDGVSAFGAYPVRTCCDLLGVLPSLVGHSVNGAFRVVGTSTGAGWSWSIIGSGVSVSDLNVPGVPVGGSAADLALAWANSITSAGSPTVSAMAYGDVFEVTVPGSQNFTLCVGSAGQTPNCCIPPDPLCSYNPDIVEVPLNGTDCNGNGIDDAIDLVNGSSIDVNLNSVPDECEIAAIRIENVHTLNGRDVSLSVTTFHSCDLEMGGYDFLIAYDQSALAFTNAERGQLLDDCDWEYFTYRHGVQGNCGDACPSGLLRVMAIADLDNGTTPHPSCYGPPDCDPHELAKLNFRVSGDRNLIGQCVPVYFLWDDCGDNVISSVDGNTLYLDHAIYDFEGDVYWSEGDDIQFPEDARPLGVGAPDVCLEGGGPGKPAPIRRIDFYNGAICIDEPPDDRGDINLNGIANEVGDAVLFSNYFIQGGSVWDPTFQEVQMLATDVNDDGNVLTIADLVYLIRIITGDEQAFPPGEHPKLSPEPQVASLDWRIADGQLTLDWSCASDAGAVLLVYKHNGMQFGDPVLSGEASGMKLISRTDRDQLRILIYGLEQGQKISAGNGVILSIPVIRQSDALVLAEAEAADYWGNPLRIDLGKTALVPRDFALLQNVPNPFNAATRITFSVPEAGDVNLAVYDVLGRPVATLADGYFESGPHDIVWQACDDQGRQLASGVYFYRIVTEKHTAGKKMVLLK